MAQDPIIGTPGLQALRQTQLRRVLRSDQGAIYFAGAGQVIDGSKSRDPLNTGDLQVLRAGLLMGQITASGKWAPSILGDLTVAHTSDSATAMTVGLPTAVELVRRIGASGTFNLTGPPTAAGTVATVVITYSAVDVLTGIITISTEATDFIAGSLIQPTDGSQTIRVLIGDGHGAKVTDQDEVSTDVEFVHTGGGQAMLVAGQVDVAQIIEYPTDASLKTFVKDALEAVGSFIFDDDVDPN